MHRPYSKPTLTRDPLIQGVYLIHFDQPLSDRHTSQHYIGYTSYLSRRLYLHSKGRSHVPYVREYYKAGISFRLVRIWPEADREFERELKNRKCGPRLCPICRHR